MNPFEYHRPDNLQQALDLLGQYGPGARPLAGGQSLMPLLSGGMLSPDAVVSLAGIPELRRLDWDGQTGLTMGAMVTQREIETSALVQEKCPALAMAVSRVASVPVRNLGTLCGNLCHAGPGADPPAILIALGALLQVASAKGLRTLPVEDLFAGPYETILSDGELLVSVRVPRAPAGTRAAYLKHSVRAIDPAIVGVAAAVELHDGLARDVRIGMVGGSPQPARARAAEDLLRGRRLEPGVIREAAQAAAAESDPVTDGYSSAEYRRKMVPVFIRRTLERILESAH